MPKNIRGLTFILATLLTIIPVRTSLGEVVSNESLLAVSSASTRDADETRGAQNDVVARVEKVRPNDEITVLGTRLSAAKSQTPDGIDRVQIELSAALTTVDLLRQLPGVTSIEPGGAGGIPELYLRGADPNFVTVFVDGVQMNDPTDARGGAFDFLTVSPGEIERIEIIRGPFSALYGSGALAGAINLITRPPQDRNDAGTARLAIGTDDYWSAGVSMQGGSETIGVAVNANHADYGEPTQASGRTATSVSAIVDAEIRPGVNGELSLRVTDGFRTGYTVASGGPRLAAAELVERSNTNELSLAATLNWRSDNTHSTAQITFLDSDDDSVAAAIPDGVFSGTPASTSETSFERVQVVLHTRYGWSDDAEVGVGIQYQHEQGAANGELDFGFFQLPTSFQRSRYTVAPFIEGRILLSPSITAFGGLRYDDYSDGDSTFSPRVGAEYRSRDDGIVLSFSWGEARKKPSFFALGDPLIGNTELSPEDSRGYEVGIEFRTIAGLTVSASIFEYEYKNLIDFDFATFSLVNRSKVKIDGAEARIDGSFRQRWVWSAFASTQRNVVDGRSGSLLHRPETSAGAVISWRGSDRWNVMLASSYYGRRPSSSIPGGATTLGSYVRFNASATRRISENLALVLSLDNILNKDYESVAGFGSSGRQVRIGARFGL